MARTGWHGRTLVYRYGVPRRLHGQTVDLDDTALAQLRLAHELKNKLVELWRAHRDAVAACWQTRPEVADAQARLHQASQRRRDAETAVNESRQQRRSKRADPQLRQAATAARHDERAAKRHLKTVKDAAYEALTPQLHQLNADHSAAISATRREYTRDHGLYWPTANLIVEQHRNAENQVRRAHKEGRPSELHFRRWRGEGQLAMQLQRTSRDPPRTPQRLTADDSPWRGKVQLPAQMAATPDEWANRPSRRAGRLGEIAVRIASQERQPMWCRLPVIVHRPLPIDADVTDVRLTRRRIAAGHRLSVDVTVRLPDPQPSTPTGRVAGVDTGWRMMDDGSLRVAVWTTTGDTDPPLDFPHHVTDAIHHHADGGEVRLPASWLAEWDRLARIQQRRDKTFDRARHLLLDWLGTHPHLADTLDLDPQQVAMWRSPQRLAAIARTAADQLGGDHPLARQLETWRHTDRRLWERHAHTSDQLTARRTDLYRNIAARLVELVDVVAVKTGFVPEATRTPPADQDDTHQGAHARRHAQIAAPASLTRAIQEAATNQGIRIVELDARDTSATHHGCGGQLDDDARRHHVHVRCADCGVIADQDHNTARLLVEAALYSQSDTDGRASG